MRCDLPARIVQSASRTRYRRCHRDTPFAANRIAHRLIGDVVQRPTRMQVELRGKSFQQRSTRAAMAPAPGAAWVKKISNSGLDSTCTISPSINSESSNPDDGSTSKCGIAFQIR